MPQSIRSLIVTLLAAAVWLAATPAALAQSAPDEARSVLLRFMDAVVARDAAAAGALATDDLRAHGPAALVGTSNPCQYRYAVTAFALTSPTAAAASVRVYEHFWPGDSGGGAPASTERAVGLVQTADGWRVGRLGPPQARRAEPDEPHGPTTSACTVGHRPGVWLASPTGLPATGGGGLAADAATPVVAAGAALLGVGLLWGADRLLRRVRRPSARR
jgi:hypothetical protein